MNIYYQIPTTAAATTIPAPTATRCRYCGSRLGGPRIPEPRVVVTGRLTVDLVARRALVDGIEIACSQREWDLLAYLAERVGCWCPNVDIVSSVWGPEWVTAMPYGHQRGRRDDHLLNITVGRLRRKLGEARALVVARSGNYRLVEAVQ